MRNNLIRPRRACVGVSLFLLFMAGKGAAAPAVDKAPSVAASRTIPAATPDPPRALPAASAIPVAKAVAAASPPATETNADSASATKWLTGQSMDALNDKRALVIGDKLSFTVVEDEAPPVALVVTDSGEMEVPYLGRVMAVQKTCKQLSYQIKSQLEKEFYYQATVLLGLDSAGSRVLSRGKVYVVGQVRAPGPQEIPVDEVWTVSKAILRAGGFAPYANKRKVKLIRGGSGRGDTETVFVDIVEVLEKGETRKDPEVSPDDLIVVSEKLINF